MRRPKKPEILPSRRNGGIVRGTVLIRVLTALVAVAAGLLAIPAAPAAATATPTTFQDHAYASSVTSPPSADKPQSKLWNQDGSWWGLMLNPDGKVDIYELRAGHTWQDTGTQVDERSTSTGDALWDGRNLYVASRAGSGDIRVYRFSYFAESRSYSLDAGFPVSVRGGGSESATIARDNTGVAWVTFTQAGKVWYAHSDNEGNAWTAADPLPVSDYTVASDDVSGVIAFTGKVGIMYSDQSTGRFYFAVHEDGHAADDWSLEIAMQDDGGSDDHINLKNLITDGEGRVFAAVKTSANDVPLPDTFPLIFVLIRSNTGNWTREVAGVISDKLTRPQIVIDATHERLYMLATAPEAGGKIYYKDAPLNNIHFVPGRGGVFMSWSGATINNVSTTRDAVTAQTALVAIATDTAAHRYYHAELSLGDPPDTTRPTQPTKVVASASGSGNVDLSWAAATDDVGVVAYQVARDGTVIGTTSDTSFQDEAAPSGATRTYTITAADAAGNTSLSSWPTTVWVPPSGGTGITYRGTTAGTNDTAGQLTLPVPSGGQPGDVLLASLDVRGSPNVTAPAGWSLVRNDQYTSTIRKVTYVHVAAGGDPASVTWTFSKAQAAVGVMLRYRGVSTSAPVGDNRSVIQSSAGASLAAPAVTTTSANSVVVVLLGTARNTAITPDNRTTERAESGTTVSTYRVSGEAADMRVAQPGTVNAFTATTSPATPAVATIGQSLVLQAG
jgi:hypothetical protein